MPEQLVTLSELSLDLPEPVAGWAAEMAARGVEVVLDDLGRAAISRPAARLLFTEHLAEQELAARRREEIEQRLVAADEARRARMPKGIPVSAEVPGLTPAMLMMLSDPAAQSARRESPLEHALQNSGSAVFHPIRDERADQ
jgi:hypothetical protein